MLSVPTTDVKDDFLEVTANDRAATEPWTAYDVRYFRVLHKQGLLPSALVERLNLTDKFEEIDECGASVRSVERVAKALNKDGNLQERNAELARLSVTDDLTQLTNIKGFRDAARSMMAALKRYEDTQIAVVMIDLDKFKIINDTYGHAAGDKALKAVAKVLNRFKRENEVAARVGGDEFALLLVDKHDKKGFPRDALRRLKEELENLSIEVEAKDSGKKIKLPLHASIGLSVLTPKKLKKNPELTVDELVEEADVSMYNDKISRSRLHGLGPRVI